MSEVYGYSPYGIGQGYGGYEYPDNGVGYESLPLKRQGIRMPQKSIVVPLRLRYYIEKPFFIQTGIETSFLLNYSNVGRRAEFNWTVGVGYKKNDFQCSLNYIEGILVNICQSQIMHLDMGKTLKVAC